MRGLRATTENWSVLTKKDHLLHGAALAVLPLRTDPSGDTWHFTGIGDDILPTTSTPQLESTAQALTMNNTPTAITSPIDFWEFENDWQHDLSAGNNNVLISRLMDFDVSLPPNNQLQARQTSQQMASPASLPGSASRKRCAETELCFQLPKEPHIEEVAQLSFGYPAQFSELLEQLIQTLDTEVQGSADESSIPDYNPTDLPITPNELQTSQKEPVKNTIQMGIADQASTSDDSQYNEALDVLDGVGNEKMLTITRGTATSLPKPMHGTAHLTAPLINLAQHNSDQIEDTRPAHSSSHDINGAGPARPATIPVCSTTSIDHELFPSEPRVEPSSGRSDTMGYVQRPDESDNLRLYPVSYADHPGALSFDHFLTRGKVEQIVLPQDPGQYLEALYDSVKQFVKKSTCSDEHIEQQHEDLEQGPVNDFKTIRARSAHYLATEQWKGLTRGVERWLKERSKGPGDDFARFALGYFAVLRDWRRYAYKSKCCEDAVTAWCDQHPGLSEALKIAAARKPFPTAKSYLITLPDIYLKTCPYFLMYAVHYPGPKMPSRRRSEISGRSQLLHELTTAAYLWQMVSHIKGESDEPKWPSQPLMTIVSMKRQKEMLMMSKAQSGLKPSKLLKRTVIHYQAENMPQLLREVFELPLEVGRFHPLLLGRVQGVELSHSKAPPTNTSDLYNAIGSFRNENVTSSNKKPTLRELTAGNVSPIEDDLLESFWRLRTLFHVTTYKTLRYQLDKLIMETEGKMASGRLPKDPFLSFACDYLRAMRIWDVLSNAKKSIKHSPEATQGVFRHLSDKYKITDAVKRVAEMESNSLGPRMLPEIYKTHPASSLLPYVTWFDTNKPEGVRKILSMAGIAHLDPMYKSKNRRSYKAVASRLLTIIAEIWRLREVDDSRDQASYSQKQ